MTEETKKPRKKQPEYTIYAVTPASTAVEGSTCSDVPMTLEAVSCGHGDLSAAKKALASLPAGTYLVGAMREFKIKPKPVVQKMLIEEVQ